ncbi:TSUP family transporter [Devosia submarina]|uniref:TSUP family transporter n=1 Tax=Devosia submarina TaxID=1173082 RepID=UPI000D337527|nr:TSUP family transporter [Devosia submarina]
MIWIGAVLLLSVFLTSMLSGIFGMAGGLVLLGILLLILPVGTAIAVQGAIQLIANGSRAYFSRAYIDLRVLAIMTGGLVTAAIALFILRYTPDLATVCITIGLLPILLWIPQHWLALDASKPHHAFLCGLLGGGINLAVGVAGPTIDMFFIRTPMDRRTIIATKAAAQVVNHAAKIAFYWSATANLAPFEWGAIALAAPFAVLGTSAGHWVLQRLTDANFKRWTRLIVSTIGIYYLARGISLLI